MSNNSIWPIERTLSGATAQGQSGSGCNGNEGVFHTPQSSTDKSLTIRWFNVIIRTLLRERNAVCVFYTPMELILDLKSYLYQIILKTFIFFMRVGWKVHGLTMILSWIVTKWGLFFNIVPLVVHIFLTSMLQFLDPIHKKVLNSRYTITFHELSKIFYQSWVNLAQNLST